MSQKQTDSILTNFPTRTPSTPSFQASELLINFILVDIPTLPIDEYEKVLESKVVALLRHRRLDSLHRNVKLAIAILIVGSQRADYFSTAFKLMCAWSFLDGPHWIIQEELIRHSIITQFDLILDRELINYFVKANSMDSTNEVDVQSKEEVKEEAEQSFDDGVKKDLLLAIENDIPDALPTHVQHSLVVKRLYMLKREMQSLVVNLQTSPTPKICMYEYQQRYNLESFCIWFVKHAKLTLLEFYHEFNLSMSRFQFVFVDESNKSVIEKTYFDDDASSFKRSTDDDGDKSVGVVKATEEDRTSRTSPHASVASVSVASSRDDAQSNTSDGISDISCEDSSSTPLVEEHHGGTTDRPLESPSSQEASLHMQKESERRQIRTIAAACCEEMTPSLSNDVALTRSKCITVRTFKGAPFIQLRKLEEEELSASSGSDDRLL